MAVLWLHRLAVISIAYIKSGHLYPLTADGAKGDFFHVFRTVTFCFFQLARKPANPTQALLPPKPDFNLTTATLKSDILTLAIVSRYLGFEPY